MKSYISIFFLFFCFMITNLFAQNNEQIFLPFEAECIEGNNEDCICIPSNFIYPFFDVTNGASGNIVFKINIINAQGNNHPFTPINIDSDLFTLESIAQSNPIMAQIRMTYTYDSDLENTTFTLELPEPYCNIEITTELPTVPEECIQMEENIAIEINDIICENDQFFVDYDINILSSDITIDEENIADNIEMTLIKENGNTIDIGQIEGLFIGNNCVLDRNDKILMKLCADVTYNGVTSFCCKEIEFHVNC